MRKGLEKVPKTLPDSNALGAWNVRTLTDNAAADRLIRRTGLVANELSTYNV